MFERVTEHGELINTKATTVPILRKTPISSVALGFAL